jgi:(4S)-4-hydroxy-5-phosphonooxypentane-2,3-dione isomerase
MLLLHVLVQVKPEFIEAFKVATEANASASRKELGVARFDFAQQADDPTRFVLLEAYREPAAHQAHRDTPHYVRWREEVAPMMAAPRTAVKYFSLSPGDTEW